MAWVHPTCRGGHDFLHGAIPRESWVLQDTRAFTLRVLILEEERIQIQVLLLQMGFSYPGG